MVRVVRQRDAAEPCLDAGHQRRKLRRALVERREHQPVPLGHARRRQPHLIDAEALGTAHLGGAAQPAVERVAPAVVLAHQFARPAAVAGGQRPGAMAADVVQGAQHAVVAAHDNQRHAVDLRHRMIARRGDLRCMGQELPAAREYGRAIVRMLGGIDIAVRRQRVRGSQRLRRAPVVHVGRG